MYLVLSSVTTPKQNWPSISMHFFDNFAELRSITSSGLVELPLYTVHVIFSFCTKRKAKILYFHDELRPTYLRMDPSLMIGLRMESCYNSKISEIGSRDGLNFLLISSIIFFNRYKKITENKSIDFIINKNISKCNLVTIQLLNRFI